MYLFVKSKQIQAYLLISYPKCIILFILFRSLLYSLNSKSWKPVHKICLIRCYGHRTLLCAFDLSPVYTYLCLLQHFAMTSTLRYIISHMCSFVLLETLLQDKLLANWAKGQFICSFLRHCQIPFDRPVLYDFIYMRNLKKDKWTHITKQKQNHRYREQTGGY